MQPLAQDTPLPVEQRWIAGLREPGALPSSLGIHAKTLLGDPLKLDCLCWEVDGEPIRTQQLRPEQDLLEKGKENRPGKGRQGARDGRQFSQRVRGRPGAQQPDGAGGPRRPSPSRSAPPTSLPEVDIAANPQKIQGDGQSFRSKLGYDRFG